MSLRSTIAPLLLLALAIGGCDRQTAAPEQATPSPAAAAPAPKEGEKVVVDTIGTLDRSHKGEAPPPTSFNTPEGTPTTIAAFKGKPVLVNLWATWCGPCVKEMPTLDQVAARMAVVSVSQDLDAAKVPAFFAAAGLKNLKAYHDPKVELSIVYQASLPTSILYDSSGHEVWRMTGGMDWTTPTAADLLAEAK